MIGSGPEAFQPFEVQEAETVHGGSREESRLLRTDVPPRRGRRTFVFLLTGFFQLIISCDWQVIRRSFDHVQLPGFLLLLLSSRASVPCFSVSVLGILL